MTSPAVSVVMPAFNAAPWVYRAVRSVQRSALRDWELLAVDDGSTDGTGEILRRMGERDSRIRVVMGDHAGIVGALNRGLAAARAPLIARLDADDLMHPERLSQQTGFLERHPEVTLVSSRVTCFPRRGVPEGMARYEEWLNSLLSHEAVARDFFVESPFAHPSVTFRAAAVAAAGGYRDCGWPEDYDLWMRLFESGARFAKLPDTLTFWREHPHRLTRTDPLYTLRAFRSLKLHFLQRGLLRGHVSVQVWGAGRGGRAWARDLERAGLRIARWIDIDPEKIGARLRGAPVLSPDALPRMPTEPPAAEPPLLVVIGVRGARALIRAELDGKGWVEGRDYRCLG